MGPKKTRFSRPFGERRYKKMFIIVVEGSKTEPLYFSIFSNTDSVVKIIPGTHSAPTQLLKKMKRSINEESLMKTDEAWIVVDKDEWSDQQLYQLFEWTKELNTYGLALSNPSFEYWLLLHFEEGHGITSSRECLIRLKKYLPDYEKDFDQRKITREMAIQATRRAFQKDQPLCVDWPRKVGTTVYRLVARILNLEI